MLFRLIFLLLIGGALYWGYQNGSLESLRSGGVPQVGREAKLMGPVKGAGVDVCIDKHSISRAIDSHIGSASDRLAGAAEVAAMYRSDRAVNVADNTRVKVLEASSVKVGSIPYKITKVKILSGENKGGVGWTDRADVIDTPVQELYQSMRGVSRPDNSGAAALPLSAGVDD